MIFDFLKSVFQPAAELVDNIHDSDEEMGNIAVQKDRLRNQLSQIEAEVTMKMFDLQSKVIDANNKLAVAEQQHGNMLSKSWRPICSIGAFIMMCLMGFGIIPYHQAMFYAFSSFLGIHAGLRSFIDKKK